MQLAELTDVQLDVALTDALRELRMADFHLLGDEADRRLATRHTRLAQPEALHAAARWYAANGIAVFPCAPRSKAPLIKAAHPPGDPQRATCRGECGRLGHGLYDATTDLTQIDTWWNATPTANIATPTGHRFDVIDIDVDDEQGHAGYQSLGLLRQEGKLPTVHGWVATPRGGMHAYIRPTGDGNASKFRPGLDFRGAGGYVLAPPSVGANGRRYDWLEPLHLPGLA